MADESGGDPIGKLQVDILGNLSPLEQSLQRAESLLQQYDKKLSAVLSKEGKLSAGGRRSLKSDTAPAGAVGVATPAGVSSESIKISANAKINAKDVAKDVQKGLDAHLFKINIDVANLRAQIQRAFDGIGLGNLSASSGGSERPSAGAAAVRGGGSGPIPSDLRQLLAVADAKGKGKNSKLSQAVDDFYDLIADGLNASGKANLPHGGETGKSLEKLFDLMGTFGDNVSDWAKIVDGKMVSGTFSPENLQRMGLGKQTASLAAGTGKILQQRLATSGQPLLEGLRAVRLTGTGTTAAPQQAIPSSVARAAATPRAAMPIETPRDELIKQAISSLRSTAFFATPVTQPGDVNDPGRGRGRLPSIRVAGTSAFPTSGAATGEEDAQALRQLGGGNRANIRRLRGRGQRGGAFPVDLEPFLRELERGGYRNVVETEKGDLRNLEPRGNTEGDLLESDATIRELKRRSGGRKLSLPNASGIEGQVKFVKPQDVVRRLLAERIGGDNAGEQVDAFLADPRIAAQLGQAAEQGGKSKPVPGGRPSGNFAPGAGPAANARATLRVDSLRKMISRTDDEISSLTDELEGVQGTGSTRRSAKLEGMIGRRAKKRQDLSSELEATLPYADRRMSPADARLYAAQDKLASGESRERVGAGYGLTPRERLERQFKDPGFIGADQRRKVQAGLLPDPANILKGLDAFQAQGFNYPSGATRKAALFSALKPHIDEAESQLPLKGDDRKLGKQMIGDAVRAVFSEMSFRDNEAEKGLPSDNALGRGRVPRRVMGGTRTGASTAGGAAEMRLDYERPSTSLDVERQGLGMKIEAEARKVAKRRFAALQADRKASGIADRADPRSVEDFLLSPPVRTAGGRTVPRGIRPDVMSEVESSTDVGKRAAQIRATQGFADKFVGSLGKIPDIQTQRKAAASADLINLPTGVNADEAKREISEILDSRTAQSARRPSTRGTKDPTLSDELRAKFIAGGGIVAGGGAGQIGGGGSGGGGEGASSAFGGRLPIPLPVVITGPFPLRVEFQGGGTPSRGARGRLADTLDGDVIKPGRVGASQRANIEVGMARGGTAESGGAMKRNLPKPARFGTDARGNATMPSQFQHEEGHVYRIDSDKAAGSAWNPGTFVSSGKPDKIYASDPKNQRIVRAKDPGNLQAASGGVNAASNRRVTTPISGEDQQYLGADGKWHSYGPTGSIEATPPGGNQNGPLGILKSPPYKIGAYPLTPAEPTGLGRQRQAALMAQARAVQGGGPRLSGRNADLRSQSQDVADTELSSIRAQLRRAQRSVPKRGFGASITDLVTSKLGGNAFENQLEHLGRAEREGAELSGLTNKRADLRSQRRSFINQARDLPSGSPEQKALIEQAGKVNKELKLLHPAIARSTARFTENVQAATKASAVLKSFGAAAVGGAVSAGLGSVTFGLGLAVTGPLIQAIGAGLETAIGPTIERLSGFAGTTERVTGAMSDSARQLGGRAELATAQSFAQTGLATPTAEKFAPVINERVQTEAGNKALQDQIDQLHAFERIQGENKGRAGDKNVTENTGGFFGFGGLRSTTTQIADELQTLPTANDLLAGSEPSTTYQGKGAGHVGRVPVSASQTGDVIGFFNDALKKAGVTAVKFDTALGVSQKDLDKQAAALQKIDPRLAALVQQGRATIRNPTGQVETDPAKIFGAIQQLVTTAPKPELSELLKTQAPSVQSQEQLRLERLRLQTNTLGQAETGLAFAQSGPLAPAKTGFAPEDQKKFNSELAKTQQIYDEVNQAGTKDIQIAKDFVSNAFPGTNVGADFASSLDKVASIGKEISGIQIGVQTQQAALAAQQYSAQLIVAKRSLSDAKGLAGDITGASKDNLGVLERQQFLLQKQSQQLGFGQSQRQINFQTAIAGVTAPGQTGEERAARIEQAKLEAKYAQDQLNIAEKLAALGNKGFQISASRNVTDLVRQIGLLEKGREVTLNTAVAEKRILGLSKLQDKENKKVAAFYQAAVEKTNDVMGLAAQLAAATGKALYEVERQVLSTFKDVYGGLIDTLGGPVNTEATRTRNSSGAHARGIVGHTTGTTDVTIGEAGTEAVAIVRNPRKLTGSFGGGGATTTIQINLSGNTFSNDSQYKKLIRDVQDAVEKGMGRRASQLGLSTPS